MALPGRAGALYAAFALLVAAPVAVFAVAGVAGDAFNLRGAGGPFVAFSAGVLSFVSPCVLPLVPIYLTNLAGASVENGQVVAERRKTFAHALAFVLGLSAVFIALGAGAGLTGVALQDYLPQLETAAGVLLILLGSLLIPSFGRRPPLVAALGLAVAGAVFLGVVELAELRDDRARMALLGLASLAAWAKFAGYLQFNLLQRTIKADFGGARKVGYARSAMVGGAFGVVELAELRDDRARMALLGLASLAAWAKFAGYLQFNLLQRTIKADFGGARKVGYARSAMVGGAFGVGWTPCVGPILGAILTLAATSGSAATGTYLLAFYAAGLGVPFLLAGLALGDVTRATRRMGRFLPAFEVAGAVMMIALGALLLAGALTNLNEYFGFAEFNQGL